jgi:hypothetical protein
MTMPDQFQFDVFLIYSSMDKAMVRLLEWLLIKALQGNRIVGSQYPHPTPHNAQTPA